MTRMRGRTLTEAMVLLNTAGITFALGSNNVLWVDVDHETPLHTAAEVRAYIASREERDGDE